MSLSLNNFIQHENFGHSLRAPSYRFRPKSAEEILKHYFPDARVVKWRVFMAISCAPSGGRPAPGNRDVA